MSQEDRFKENFKSKSIEVSGKFWQIMFVSTKVVRFMLISSNKLVLKL